MHIKQVMNQLYLGQVLKCEVVAFRWRRPNIEYRVRNRGDWQRYGNELKFTRAYFDLSERFQIISPLEEIK